MNNQLFISSQEMLYGYKIGILGYNIDPVCEDSLIDNIFLLIDSHQECLITVCFYESCECQFYKGNYYPIGIITRIEPVNHGFKIEEKDDSNQK